MAVTIGSATHPFDEWHAPYQLVTWLADAGGSVCEAVGKRGRCSDWSSRPSMTVCASQPCIALMGDGANTAPSDNRDTNKLRELARSWQAGKVIKLQDQAPDGLSFQGSHASVTGDDIADCHQGYHVWQ